MVLLTDRGQHQGQCAFGNQRELLRQGIDLEWQEIEQPIINKGGKQHAGKTLRLDGKSIQHNLEKKIRGGDQGLGQEAVVKQLAK